MCPISRNLSRSLDRLQQAIQDAELQLNKMPNGDKVSVPLDLEELLDTGNEPSTSSIEGPSNERRILQLRGHDGPPGKLRLAVMTIRSGDSVPQFERWLTEYPIVKRLEYAKFIPELLRTAKEAEEWVTEEVMSVCDDIEQAIADVAS